MVWAGAVLVIAGAGCGRIGFDARADGGDVWIGWSPTNFGVDGMIDDVAIWNRALSPAEIGALY